MEGGDLSASVLGSEGGGGVVVVGGAREGQLRPCGSVRAAAGAGVCSLGPTGRPLAGEAEQSARLASFA